MHVILSFTLSAMPWVIAQQSYLELSRRISKSGRGEKSDGEGVIRSRRWLTKRSEKDRLVVECLTGYRLAEMAPISQSDLVTVAAKVPHAVIYLVSALSFHELTTQIPHEVWIAIARNSEPPRLDFPPIRVSRLTDVASKAGIEKHAVDGKMVSVYSREKTLADCFSRRNEVGLDVAIEALKFYKAQGNMKVDLIMEYPSAGLHSKVHGSSMSYTKGMDQPIGILSS
jgi:hypothetical protein